VTTAVKKRYGQNTNRESAHRGLGADASGDPGSRKDHVSSLAPSIRSGPADDAGAPDKLIAPPEPSFLRAVDREIDG